MKKNGFALIEVLIAVILLSVVSAGLFGGFIQGLKAQRKIQDLYKKTDPLHILFLQLDKDLRSSVNLSDYPFIAKDGEIIFPVFEKEGEERKLLLIRYFLDSEKLKRSQQELTAKLEKERPKEKVILQNLGSFNFKFPYLDSKQNVSFESFWLTEPYYGIPRAVKLGILLTGPDKAPISYTKIVSIPQGRFGHLAVAQESLS